MVQKTFFWNKHPFWTILSRRNLSCSVFWKPALEFFTADNASVEGKGFTLVELIIVIAILSVLFTIGIGVLRPDIQLGKAKNAQRQHDFTQIQSALDAYLNDTGCYPTTLTFGQQWKVGKTVYMQKVPQDPDCSSKNPTYCYRYEINSSNSCPQWNILFTELSSPLRTNVTCPLTTIPNCLPNGYNASTDGNYCLISGQLDCGYISSNPVPTGAGGGTGGGGGGGGPTSTPTPTPYPRNCPNTYYACTGNPSMCNVEAPPDNICLGHNGNYQCYCTYSDCTHLSTCSR